MKEATGLFLDYVSIEKGLSKNTRQAYARDLGRYAAYLKKTHVANFEAATRDHIMDFLLEERERGLSPVSVARALVAIRMLHQFLAQEGKVTGDVTDVIEAPKLWKHLPDVLS